MPIFIVSLSVVSRPNKPNTVVSTTGSGRFSHEPLKLSFLYLFGLDSFRPKCQVKFDSLFRPFIQFFKFFFNFV